MLLTDHLLVWFLTPQGINNVWENQVQAKEFYMETLQGEALVKPILGEELDVEDELIGQRGEPIEDPVYVMLDESDPNKMVQFGS